MKKVVIDHKNPYRIRSAKKGLFIGRYATGMLPTQIEIQFEQKRQRLGELEKALNNAQKHAPPNSALLAMLHEEFIREAMNASELLWKVTNQRIKKFGPTKALKGKRTKAQNEFFRYSKQHQGIATEERRQKELNNLQRKINDAYTNAQRAAREHGEGSWHHKNALLKNYRLMMEQLRAQEKTLLEWAANPASQKILGKALQIVRERQDELERKIDDLDEDFRGWTPD